MARFYGDNVIQNIRDAADIVDVVSKVVQLEKKGSRYFGLCPFHNEKTPSFSVTPSRRMFYCFGCHEGGDAIKFLQKYDNMTFSEAVQELAARYQVTLPEISEDPAKEKALRDEKALLLEINKEAAVWFYKQLVGEKGKQARAYLQKRKLSAETIQKFGLGFAPLSQTDLIAFLNSKGYKTSDIIKAGLAVGDEKNGVRDKFWNRVMFPIMDTGKRVIGFGGRVMGDGEPKYLNSPETPVFDKGRNLYGLCYAKTVRKGRLILCEGYMDVISMHQAGFTEAVASLGTAFTVGQAMLLKRYEKEIVLSYDSDGAGTKAALRGIEILRQTGLKGKVLRLDPYKDPDEFIGAEGSEAFDERVRNAENPFYFEVDVLERAFDLKDPADMTSFLQQIADKLITTFPEALERDNYLKAICARYHTDERVMREAVIKSASGGSGRKTAKSNTAVETGVSYSRDEKRRDEEFRSRRMLLTWMSDEPSVVSVVKKYIEPSDFCNPIYEQLASVVFEKAGSDGFSPAQMLDLFSEEADRQEAVRAFNEEKPAFDNTTDKATALKELMSDIITRSGENKMASLSPSDSNYLAEVVAIKKRQEAFLRKEITLNSG